MSRDAESGLDIIRPGDPPYERVRHVYCATGSPAAVVAVRTADEVPTALAWARAQNGPFAIRSGGHGISSLATNDGGTVIDLAHLNGVEVGDDRRVRVGAGARWGQVARELEPHGLAISSGDSGDVGVGGLATAGGVGLLGRRYGLTIDHMLAAEIVTADGRIRRVSADEEPDLFWAIRGAGANFGIVTAFEFRAAPAGTVVRANALYLPPDMTAFLEAWGTTVEAAPREVTAFLYLGAAYAQALIVYAGDDIERAGEALAPFADLPGTRGTRAGLTAYANVPLTTGAVHTGQQIARGRSGLAVHVDRETARRIGELVAAVGTVHIRAVGGAINDVPADATAYAHRHQNFSVAAFSTVDQETLDAAWRPVHERLDGLYLSFESAHRPEAITTAFPPATLERLLRLKGRWDPKGIFTQNFGLTPQ